MDPLVMLDTDSGDSENHGSRIYYNIVLYFTDSQNKLASRALFTIWNHPKLFIFIDSYRFL